MASLEENINRAIADFDAIEAAIVEQGVDVPDGTDTSEYAGLIKSIPRNAAATTARIVDVVLLANAWVGTNSPYSQVVEVEGVTAYSQVDLTPSAEQLVIFYNKDIAFVTENENGVVTVYAIGQKPENDYTIQATVTEVNV